MTSSIASGPPIRLGGLRRSYAGAGWLDRTRSSARGGIDAGKSSRGWRDEAAGEGRQVAVDLFFDLLDEFLEKRNGAWRNCNNLRRILDLAQRAAQAYSAGRYQTDRK